jgi:hypothetical protein
MPDPFAPFFGGIDPAPDEELTGLLPRLPGGYSVKNRNVRAGGAVPKALHLSGAPLIGRNARRPKSRSTLRL